MTASSGEGIAGWRSEFLPRRWLRNPHLQTLAGNFLPRPRFTLAAETELVEVDAADGSRVLCHCHWQPEPGPRLTLILVHGLEGSSGSQYVLGNTARAWSAGCNVVRMNMRNCGGSDQLTPTLYHSGLSGDVGAVLAHMQQKFGLERIVLGGYSMGGNLVLKLAGELGSAAPAALRGVIAVSPAVDLAPSADALHEPANRVYEWHFLRGLRRRFLRKAALFPARYSPAALARVRSLRDFDEYVMAPCSGFAGADDYYYRAASARVVDRIAVPTLLLHALDDPFIRLEEETRRRLRSNPAITLLETPRGGHCAFLAAEPGEDSRWAEKTLLGFALGAG